MEQAISRQIAQQIVSSVKDVCEQDVNFIDKNGTIFASTNEKRIGDFHEIGQKVIQTGKAIEVETDDSFTGTQRGVNLPFLSHGQVIAVIGISGDPDEVRKYAYLAQKITALILREHELDAQNHNQKTQMNYVIHSLITNSPMNHHFFTEFLEKNQIPTAAEYKAIVIQLDSRYNPSNLPLVEQRIYQVFDYTGSKLYTFNYPNEYVLLLDNEVLDQWAYLLEKLAAEYHDFIKIGIGNSTVLGKLYHSYEAAKIALRSVDGNQNLIHFDDLDLDILLGSISEDAKEYFLKKTMDKMSGKEQELLRTYFQCDMSLKKTCEALYLHKNTLQYRLDKIWHDCGYNPRSFREATVLYMGLKLMGE